jgi:hypothetical protein
MDAGSSSNGRIRHLNTSSTAVPLSNGTSSQSLPRSPAVINGPGPRLNTAVRRKKAGGGSSRAMYEQRFTSYLTFGVPVTLCLCLFLGMYCLVLLTLSPLLRATTTNPDEISENGEPHHAGDALKPALDPFLEKVKHVHDMLPHPAQRLAEDVAEVLKHRIDRFREKKGLTDEALMNNAVSQINEVRAARQKEQAQRGATEGQAQQAAVAQPVPGKRVGVVVLGMHRSGTSMLAGLMVKGMGYFVGEPLIGQAFDNEKGFFELLPVVLQNDEFMKKQNVWWSENVRSYDPEKAIVHKEGGLVPFKEGQMALRFLNDPANSPWIQKDPRMCITLKTWLKLLNAEPAVVFTFRHPLEVALSLKKRQKFALEHGLRLWIVYNQRAIENSAGLCRVLSSNDKLLADPLKEIQRIRDELTDRCNVPAPPKPLAQEDVDEFIDPALLHNRKAREAKDAEKAVITEIQGCIVREYESDYEPSTPEYDRERKLYLSAMKVFCDLTSGAAYHDKYEWPTLD